MSANLESKQAVPKEVWLISHEDAARQKVFLTAEQEDEILDSGRYEIVHGELKERAMPSPTHGRIQAGITAELHYFVKQNRLGLVYTETMFQLADDLNRISDVAFLSFERFPETGETEGRFYLAPDLAIEIVSPSDIFGDVFKKIDEYLAAEVKQVWLVAPERKTLTIYRSRTDATILTETEELVGESFLSGFRLKLSDIFQIPANRINE